jgi:hypothetical protein
MKTRNRIINPIKDESEKPKTFILLVTTIYDIQSHSFLEVLGKGVQMIAVTPQPYI